MSDLLSSLIQADKLGIIAITFVAGLSGSIHCIGMCGAFASTCAANGTHLASYHLGRLLSYSTLGLLGGLIGSIFIELIEDPIFQAIPSIALGLAFIFFGLRVFRAKSVPIKAPATIQRILNHLYKGFFTTRNITLRSFLLGISSSLLPCGLLYGVLVTLTTFQSPATGAIGMASFCLGTIPALFVAPKLITKFLNPLKEKWPQVVAMTTTSVGVFIITIRLVSAYEKVLCH